ncbi:MAG: PKD domain-containing protein [Halobacteria archaeon]
MNYGKTYGIETYGESGYRTRKLRVGIMVAAAFVAAALILTLSGGVSSAAQNADCKVDPRPGSGDFTKGDKAVITAQVSGDVEIRYNRGYGDWSGWTRSKVKTMTWEKTGTFTPKIQAKGQNDSQTEANCGSLEVKKDVPDLNAGIDYGPHNPEVNDDVRFNSNSQGDIVEYTWTDTSTGRSKNGRSASFSFRDAGRHKITLRVRDSQGDTDRASVRVRVKNDLVARCSLSKRSIDAGDSVTLDAENSKGANYFRYDKYGDNSYTSWSLNSEKTFQYDSDGRFRPSVEVTGRDKGKKITSDDCARLTVRQTKPEAQLGVNPSDTKIGHTVTFNARDSKDRGSRITRYMFDVDGDGRWEIDSSDNVYTYTYEHPGRYNARLKVIDRNGESDTTSKTVRIEGHEPDVEFSYSPKNPEEGQPVSFDGRVSISKETIATVTWEVDGERVGSGRSLTHEFPSPGSYQVTLEAESNQGVSNQVTKTVDVKEIEGKKLSQDVRQIPPSVIAYENFQLKVRGNPSTVQWDTNDDGSFDRTGNPVSLTFKNSGSHKVKVKKRGGSRGTTTEEVTVTINPVNLDKALGLEKSGGSSSVSTDEAVNYWKSGKALPGTDGSEVTDEKILELLDEKNGE